MKQLRYTFEGIQPALGAESSLPILADTVVGLRMASIGLPGITRLVNTGADPLEVMLSFPDDQTLLRFNLRVERALAARGVKIKDVHSAEVFSRRYERRAVA